MDPCGSRVRRNTAQGGGEQNRGGARTGEESTPRRGSESDSILTDEELEMLLADDPPDPDER